MPTARLVLVRHGESRATVDRIVGGRRGCQGLTEGGRRQADALADRLLATRELEPVSALMASTLPRAVETASLLCRALGGLDVQQDGELCELEPGEGDGLSWDEFQQRYAGFNLGLEPFRPLAPGGESLASFALRVGSTLHRLAERFTSSTVVAVCHGGVIEQSMIQGLLMPASAAPGQRMETVPNTSMTEWLVDVEPGAAQRWRLVRFADAAHLAGAAHRGVSRPA